jgi:hypothetical protein
LANARLRSHMLDKIFAIKIILKNRPALNLPNNNLMQYTGRIQSC